MCSGEDHWQCVSASFHLIFLSSYYLAVDTHFSTYSSTSGALERRRIADTRHRMWWNMMNPYVPSVSPASKTRFHNATVLQLTASCTAGTSFHSAHPSPSFILAQPPSFVSNRYILTGCSRSNAHNKYFAPLLNSTQRPQSRRSPRAIVSINADIYKTWRPLANGSTDPKRTACTTF